MLAFRNRFAQAAVGAAGRSLTVATLLPLTVVSLDLARTLAAEASSSKKEPSKELLLLRQLRALPASQAPKAPANAYSLFVKRNYDDVAKHYVGPAKEKPRNVAVKLGQLWKNAPEATRKEYFGAAEELRAKYNAAVKAYQANITPTQAIVENRRRYLRRLLGKKAARPAQDPNRPKRPPTAYMLFVKSVRDGGDASQKKVIGTTIAGKSIGEIGKLLGTAWRSLNPTEKKRYTDESAPALESYKKDVVAYNTRTKVVDRRKELSKDLRKAALGKVKAKPKRRAAGTRRPAAKKAKKVVKKKAVVKKAKKAVKKPVKKAVKKVAKKPVAKKTSTGKKPAPKKKLAVKKN